MSESIGKNILEKLSYKRKSVYEQSSSDEIKKIYEYADGYMKFLDAAKTERESAIVAVEMLKSAGFSEYKIGDKLSVGDKIYLNHLGKSIIAITVGKEDIETCGIRIIAAHIDAPRIDLKQVPMYEDAGMCFFKTHYYGGVKKYQWTAIPLALHGVIMKANGECVKVSVGESEEDPVFYINDLLPHLAARQASETLGKAVPGENLNILIGALPYDDKEVEEKIKLTALSILNEKYGVTEEDLLSAELSLVPAFKARDIGFDRALIGSYAHDDRVCAYPALTALIDNSDTDRTTLVVLADKEEIGSDGVTGMKSKFLSDIIDEICRNLGKNPAIVRYNSKCLSADVAPAFDPTFADVYEKRNSAMISCGATMCKYTGSRGKNDSNDASAEFISFVRRIFDENGVIWQTAELGKVDEGGGGTVAKYIAGLNIETVDIGVPVISMHAPYEVVSKADVYSAYQAFSAFVK